ncbi:MAG: hypothetical protein HY537_08605 [Deltaproteobacteria bacterium]|nr:hypothetical protein [Deltaproteobacteria bacterium]
MKHSATKSKTHATKTLPYSAEVDLRNFCEATANELSGTLSTIIGEIDYASDCSQLAAKERAMGIAIGAAEKALSLVKNLKFFVLQAQPHPELIDVSQLVLDTIEWLEHELEARQIQANVLVESSVYANLDPSALQQALLNILNNAKDTCSSGDTITITLKKTLEFFEISCVDNRKGTPIDPSELLAPSLNGNAREKSLALRLIVSKILVESLGGELLVPSSTGPGSSLTLQFPSNMIVAAPPFSRVRKSRRIRLSFQARLTLADQKLPLDAEMCVLSHCGCFLRLRTSTKLPIIQINDEAMVQLQLYGQEVGIANARIASLCWTGPSSGIGLEFVEWKEEGRRLVSAILKSQ